MSVNAAQQYHTNQVHFLRVNFTFANEDETISLGWVPAGASVIGGGVVVATAFNSGTSDTMDLGFRNAGDGTTADPNEYATLLDITTAGVIVADELATAGDAYLPEGAEITLTYNSTGTAPTAGSGYAYLTYLVDNS
ncbi:hypothetical protein [uncultured Ruegeria sp.]|uniref:hypothetical protein n=1 Tax=uncultured Ruegeria sp. TaxID=259304 RepID=UPI002632D9CD|nr:hypothetical protein [uncultured Ruegeria sp.]